MILAGGLIRTLDPQDPDPARALAVAGEHVAGGVGVHETALASLETIDLRGRVVVPGFTGISHVHFATWALAQTEVNLDGCASLGEAVARIRAGGLPGDGRWLRGYGWRSGDWTDGREPTRHDLDAITGDVPAALIAKDYHSLWLNSAATRSTPAATSRWRAASSNEELTAHPRASCAKRRHGASRRGTSRCPTTSTSPRCGSG